MLVLQNPYLYSFVNNPIAFKLNAESNSKVDLLINAYSISVIDAYHSSLMTGSANKLVNIPWHNNKEGITISMCFSVADNITFDIHDPNFIPEDIGWPPNYRMTITMDYGNHIDVLSLTMGAFDQGDNNWRVHIDPQDYVSIGGVLTGIPWIPQQNCLITVKLEELNGSTYQLLAESDPFQYVYNEDFYNARPRVYDNKPFYLNIPTKEESYALLDTFSLSAYPVYTTHLTEFEISDILKSYFTSTGLANDMKIKYDAIFSIGGTVLHSYSGYAVCGGISKQYLMWLVDRDTNPFLSRFLNQLANFLFTTRTASPVMSLFREELAPVYFLYPGNNAISIVGGDNSYDLPASILGVPSIIDIPSILASWPDGDSLTTIYICVSSIKLIKINIQDCFFEEKYTLRFRNSLGVFENLLVTGKATSKPTFADNDSFNEFSDEYFMFRKSRNRVSVTDKIEVSSGYKGSLNLSFIKDILISDEIYFDDGEFERKCMVTSSDFSQALKSTAPEFVTLLVEFTEDDSNYTALNEINEQTEVLESEDESFIISEDNFLI